MAREPARFGIARTWREGDLAFEGLAFVGAPPCGRPRGVTPRRHPADAVFEAMRELDGPAHGRVHPSGADYIYLDGVPPYETDSFLYRCRGAGVPPAVPLRSAPSSPREIAPGDRLAPAPAVRLHEAEGICWAFDAAAGRTHVLSPQAFWIMKNLGDGLCVGDLIESFARAHDLPPERAREALPAFLADLVARGLLTGPLDCAPDARGSSR